ncbi:MAG: Crp/Fnr family transcriptional regulator [Hyphomonadaceae bacterium]|nr:Crp/Fnr family transcriptional regulator [Hyphomonadaceae bacterium]
MNLSALEQAIVRYASPLTPDPKAWAAFAEPIRARRLAKGEHLVREGDAAHSLYFIQSGLLRYYYLADGVEHTGQFFDDGMFVGDVLALTTRAPCVQNIDALAPSDLLLIPREALQAAYDADHAFERFGRRAMEEVAVGSQRRSANLLKLSPEQRYASFIAARPEVAKRVPQYIIASYLGITPEALSRIRKRRTE